MNTVLIILMIITVVVTSEAGSSYSEKSFRVLRGGVFVFLTLGKDGENPLWTMV